jgi:predicted secreted protein
VHRGGQQLQWYSGAQILGWVALMSVLPLAVRSRKLCGFWYKRPEKT